MTSMAHPKRLYTMTHTGRPISPDEGVPSLLDIAIGNSRITRFAGQGKQFFSVLAHMMWLDDLYTDRLANPDPAYRLAILLHDAHEVLTSDIPSPHKTQDMKVLQDALDQRIFDRYWHQYGGFAQYGHPESSARKIVKEFDWRGLLTEYWEIGPAHPCYLDHPAPEDRDFLRHWMKTRTELWADESAAQTNYIHRVLSLL